MIIKAYKALIGREIKENIFVTIKDTKIIKISNKEEIFDLETPILSPGFINNHIHGSGGFDFMDANQEAYDTILTNIVKSGTTSVMATAITQSIKNLTKMYAYASIHKRKNHQASIIGIHSEGPFLCIKKKGAQPSQYIIDGDIGILKQMHKISNGKLKVITFAPEHDKENKMLKYAVSLGLKAQIGHTMANEQEVKEAVKDGASGITHAYNAMPKSLKNETAGFVAREDIYGEIIVDGVHNSPKQVNEFIKLKGKEKTILVTDSIRCAGMPDGEYELGGQVVTKKGLECKIKNLDILAGSAALMIDVVKKTKEITDLNLEETLALATINVAQYHNLENKGIIEEGADADLLLLDNNLNIIKTITMGEF